MEVRWIRHGDPFGLASVARSSLDMVPGSCCGIMMTVKIATVPTFEAAADVVVGIWREVIESKLLRFEGFDGVGKSGLARLVASRIGAEHIEGDKFAFKPEAPTPYPGCLRQAELDAAITAAVASGKPVILDAVCLDEVMPSSRWGRGFVVYVKRLSFNNQNPMWHHGFEIEDEVPEDEPHRGIVLYHQKSKPHERADLIIELPDMGHEIWNFKFDRGHCFDPLGAEIVPHRGGRSRTEP
jgi:hypothetical protein